MSQVLSVVKTMRLLETLSKQEEVGVTELAEAVEGNKSTVHRFLNTLSDLGYVRQNSQNEKYSLTLKLFQVGVNVLSRMDLHKAAKPQMEYLAGTTKETIHLAAIEEDHVFYLDKIESTLTLRVTMGSAQGRFAQVNCTGVGKVIAAWASPELREKMLSYADWKQHTENTITTKKDLIEELDKIKNQGFSYDMEENEPGVRCVAAPIFDQEGQITAAISVTGPSIRLNEEFLPQLATIVQNAGNEVSETLGHKI